jgi:hypothetical protein
MNKLLKEAIADAKAVRETALANAKIALEEAFTPRLQSMLSARLSEADDEMYDEEEEIEAPAPEVTEEGEENDTDGTPDPGPAIEEEDEMGEEELDLEAIIRELEGDEEVTEEDLDSSDIGTGDNKVDAYSSKTEDPGEGEISIDEIINALREAEGEDEEMKEEEEKEMKEEEEKETNEEAEKELEEAIRVIKFLKNKINEVNLLNAKLLFSNKLFRNYELNESQKMKVIENFDRANNLREVKLVFSTLCESLTVSKTAKKQNIKEGYASKPTRSTAPKKEILSEGNTLAERWKKLANLK